MKRFLYDTSIFVYALGREHRYREPCREIVRLAASGHLQGEASVDLLQELMHQRARRTGDRPGGASAARNVTKLVTHWYPVEASDVQRAIELFETFDGLDARDAVFAAIALNHDIDAILTTDRAFEGIDGLKRIDPADQRSVASLGD